MGSFFFQKRRSAIQGDGSEGLRILWYVRIMRWELGRMPEWSDAPLFPRASWPRRRNCFNFWWYKEASDIHFWPTLRVFHGDSSTEELNLWWSSYSWKSFIDFSWKLCLLTLYFESFVLYLLCSNVRHQDKQTYGAHGDIWYWPNLIQSCLPWWFTTALHSALSVTAERLRSGNESRRRPPPCFKRHWL